MESQTLRAVVALCLEVMGLLVRTETARRWHGQAGKVALRGLRGYASWVQDVSTRLSLGWNRAREDRPWLSRVAAPRLSPGQVRMLFGLFVVAAFCHDYLMPGSGTVASLTKAELITTLRALLAIVVLVRLVKMSTAWFMLAALGVLYSGPIHITRTPSLVMYVFVLVYCLILGLQVLYFLSIPFIRWVLIPRGSVWWTYQIASFLADFISSERRSHAVILGVQAWRRSRRDVRELDWLYGRLQKEPAVTSTMLVAAGVLHAAQGRRDAARAWMQSVQWLASRCFGDRRMAAEWLCAEAATRGAWSEVERWSRQVWWSLPVRYLRGVALWRLQMSPRPSLASLRWMEQWVRPGLRGGAHLAEAGSSAVPEVDNAATSQPDALSQALSLHVRAWASERATPDLLVRVGEAWDKTLRQVEGEGDVSRVDWHSTVMSELTALLEVSRVGLEDLGRCDGLLEEARRGYQRQVLLELDTRSEALSARKDEKLAHPAVEEWEEWMLARLAYERVLLQLGRPSLHRCWLYWHARLCNYGVWLYNDRKERLLGHHIFRWLLEEARLMEDPRAIALQERNVSKTRMRV